MNKNTNKKIIRSIDKKIIVLLACFTYACAFYVLYRILDRGVGALAILPVIVVAWCYGSKAGILTAFLSFPFNVIFLNILGDEGINTFIARAGGVAGTFALILIGWVVGRLSELSIQVKQELAERKKAEEKLRQITQTLMALVKESPLGIIVLDTSGKVSLWNPAANNTLGWNAAETTGKIFPSFDTHSREELWHKIRTVLDGTPIKNIELQHKHSNGRLVNIALSAVPLHDEAGVVNGILILMEDITEEKRLQQEILFVSGREQRRIGQDLHDGLGQVLTGIGFLTRSLEKRLRSKSLPEAEDAATIGRLVNEAVEQTRNLSRGLYPATLENEGFKAAIEELASSVGSRFSVQCKFICNSDHDIHDPFLSIHLYRIVQEATTNAVRHGEPRRIIISLDVEDTRGILTVRDDGKGFAIAEHGGGMGINLMRYRAKMIGADFTLQSSPGQGTVVICSFTFPHQTNTPLNHLEKEQQHGKTTP